MTRGEAGSEKSHWERVLSSYLYTVSDCNQKIALLKPAYNRLAEIKSIFKIFRKSEKQFIDEDYQWRGKDYNNFISAGSELSDECIRYEKNHLDAAMDEINNAIAYYKSKKTEVLPLIGTAKKWIDYFQAELENALN